MHRLIPIVLILTACQTAREITWQNRQGHRIGSPLVEQRIFTLRNQSLLAPSTTSNILVDGGKATFHVPATGPGILPAVTGVASSAVNGVSYPSNDTDVRVKTVSETSVESTVHPHTGKRPLRLAPVRPYSKPKRREREDYDD